MLFFLSLQIKNKKMKLYDNRKVRKQSFLLKEEKAMQLLHEANYGFLAMQAEKGGGYGVPMNYVFEEDRIYLHAAVEGEKIDCLLKEPKVSFCVMGSIHTIPRKFTVNYTSVMVHGKVLMDLSHEEQVHAMELFIAKYSPEDVEVGMRFVEVRLPRTRVFCIQIERISGKDKFLSD